MNVRAGLRLLTSVLDIAFECVARPCGAGLKHGAHPATWATWALTDANASEDRKVSVPNQVLDLASAARWRAARSQLENF